MTGWEHLVVLLLAATPGVELLVVVPLGIGYGLSPIVVGVLVVIGNTLPVIGILALHERWRRWRTPAQSGAADPLPDSPRRSRAKRLWRRYGLAGMAMLAPMLTGAHIATVLALSLGSPRRPIALWMTASIVFWTGVVMAATLLGIEGFRWVRS